MEFAELGISVSSTLCESNFGWVLGIISLGFSGKESEAASRLIGKNIRIFRRRIALHSFIAAFEREANMISSMAPVFLLCLLMTVAIGSAALKVPCRRRLDRHPYPGHFPLPLRGAWFQHLHQFFECLRPLQ